MAFDQSNGPLASVIAAATEGLCALTGFGRSPGMASRESQPDQSLAARLKDLTPRGWVTGHGMKLSVHVQLYRNRETPDLPGCLGLRHRFC